MDKSQAQFRQRGLKDMRKLIVIGAVVIVLLGGGGWYTKYLVAQKVSDQLVTELRSPDIQKQIDKMLKDQNVQAALSSMGNKAVVEGSGNSTSGSSPHSDTSSGSTNPGSHQTSSGQSGGSNDHQTSSPQQSGGSNDQISSIPTLRNRADVIRFAMSRFSTTQILHLMTLYLHRNTLTSAQKDELKTAILSRFTPQEIQEMAVAVNK